VHQQFFYFSRLCIMNITDQGALLVPTYAITGSQAMQCSVC
jgi:hypothetical protein